MYIYMYIHMNVYIYIYVYIPVCINAYAHIIFLSAQTIACTNMCVYEFVQCIQKGRVLVMETLLIKTRLGDIRVRLRADKAPQHCVFIKSLVSAGKYNGCIFYRYRRWAEHYALVFDRSSEFAAAYVADKNVRVSEILFRRAEPNFVLQGGLRDAVGNQRPTGLTNPPLVRIHTQHAREHMHILCSGV